MNRYIAAVALALAASGAQALTLYVHPTKGNDNAAGSSAAPLRTLQGAHSRVASLNKAENVVVVVKASVTRPAQPVRWTYSKPPYSVTITGEGAGITVFDGAGNPDGWLTIAPVKGQAANITVRRLTVTNFGEGIDARGSRDSVGNFISNVTISGVAFLRIGGKYTTNKADTYAALRLLNVRNATVTGSSFRNIENAGRGDLLHAIYLAHYSTGNKIVSNTFTTVSGDPVRTRDGSGNNTISNNKFVRTGVTGQFSDWYCVGAGCTKGSAECPSFNNVFSSNQIGTGYSGRRIALFQLFESSAACGGGTRLRTAKNVNI